MRRRGATNADVDALMVERGLRGMRFGDVRGEPVGTKRKRQSKVLILWEGCPHGPRDVWVAALKSGTSGCKSCSARETVSARRLREAESSLAHALDMEQHKGYTARLIDVRPRGTQGRTERWVAYVCPAGHEGEMRLNNFVNGHACPNCCDYGYDSTKPGSVYVVTGRGLVKVGIANTHAIDRRLRTHRWQGLDEVLHTVHFGDGADAVALEDLWLEKRDTFPTTQLPTKKDLQDGYTEAAPAHPEILQWIDTQLIPMAG